MPKPVTILAFLAFCFTLAGAQTLPFLADAAQYARSGTVAKGTAATVYGTVTLVSGTPGTQVDRTVVAYGNGRFLVVGTGETARLEGEMPLFWNSGNPFAATQVTLSVSLALDGSARVQMKIGAKAFLGRPPVSVQFSPVGEILTASGLNLGGFRLMTLALNKGVFPLPASASAPAQPALPPKPVGVRVRVSSTLVVTNADDGIADNTVELYGTVAIGKTQAFNLFGNSAGKNAQFTGSTSIVDIYFSDPNSRLLNVSGLIVDRDTASGADTLFMVQNLKLDILKAVQDKPQGITTFTVPGDRDSENAELYINVEKVEDLY